MVVGLSQYRRRKVGGLPAEVATFHLLWVADFGDF